MTHPYLIAHRGASTQAPENTLEAFDLAFEQEADGIEGDFRLTIDGNIVCFHDQDTFRVSACRYDISQTTLKQLKEIDIGSWYNCKFSQSRILTIAEVFSLIPSDKKIYIEIKVGIEILPQLFLEIERAKLNNDQIKVISFNAEVIRDFKIQRSDIEAFWVIDCNAEGFDRTETEILGTLKESCANGLSSNYISVEESLIKNIINAGYSMHLWAIDEMEVAMRFLDLGVSSITTNKPDLLKPLFTNRK